MGTYNMNKANIICLAAELGMEGYFAHHVSDTKAEFCLQHDGHTPLVTLTADMAADSVIIRRSDMEIVVSSMFNNGSGFVFRTMYGDGEVEFGFVDRARGRIVLNDSSFITPAGWAREAQATAQIIELERAFKGSRDSALDAVL